jgi:hypothetical protein
MADDFTTTQNALAKLHQETEVLSHLSKPAYLDTMAEIGQALAPIYRQQLEIRKAFDDSGITAQIKALSKANQHWQEILKEAGFTRQIAESFATAHKSWLEHFKPLHVEFSQLAQLSASAKRALFDASLQLNATERLMAHIDFNALRNHFQVEIPV